MMSGQQINDLQLEAAARASREGQTPFVTWGTGELTNAPFLGEYVPAGWRAATWADVPIDKPRGSTFWSGEQAALFVDSSGFGSEYEPALSVDAADDWYQTLLAADSRTWGIGILEAGQFQVYIGLYVKDETATGHPVDESIGLCPDCGDEDGTLDYHDCPAAPHEHYFGPSGECVEDDHGDECMAAQVDGEILDKRTGEPFGFVEAPSIEIDWRSEINRLGQ